MSANQGAPVILRYETTAERDAFLAAFGNGFDIIPCACDQEAMAAITDHSAPPPALVIHSTLPDQARASALLANASRAGCFRILICDRISLDAIIQLLDENALDRCYTQPWDENNLRADLFVATMAVNDRYWPEPEVAGQAKPLALIVDDETAATKYLRKHLLRLQDRFDIRCAASADEALDILNQEGDQVAVMMTDQRMPGMKGVQLISELRQSYPYITRILTSAYGELDVALGAVNQGRIYRYEKKPWHAPKLLPVLDDAIAQHYRLRAASDAMLSTATNAFEASRQQRRATLMDALAEPAPQALGPTDIIGRFLSDLEHINTVSPGTAQRRTVNPADLDRQLIRGLRGEVSSFMTPEPGSQLVQGCPVPSAIVDALDALLAASGLSRSSLTVSHTQGTITLASSSEQPLRMYSHLLSPLAGISNPLIRQQGALLALYLWADRLGGKIRLTGGRQVFSLALALPVTEVGKAIEFGDPWL